jgi:hypothetical protein
MIYRSDEYDSGFEYVGISRKGTFPFYKLDRALKLLRNDVQKAFRYADKNSNTIPGRTYTKKQRAYAAEQKRVKHMKDRQKRSEQRRGEGKYYNNLNSKETFGFDDPIALE